MARPRGAMASALRRIPDFQRLNSAALAGHARLFIHPAYARLVNSEPYVKRLIPILIVLFVVALGVMRAVALYQARSEAQSERRASPVADRQGGRQRACADPACRSRSTEPSETLQGQLENALPPLADRLGAPDPRHGPAGHGRRRGAARARIASAATSTRFSGRASR